MRNIILILIFITVIIPECIMLKIHIVIMNMRILLKSFVRRSADNGFPDLTNIGQQIMWF